MENIQDYLTTAIIAMFTTFLAIIALNLCTGLVELWNYCGQAGTKTKSSEPQKLNTTQLPQGLKLVNNTENTENTLTNLSNHTVALVVANDAHIQTTQQKMLQRGCLKSPLDETQTNLKMLVLARAENTKSIITESSSLTSIATVEQLQALSLKKLKQLAANHSIQGRAAMTKNIKTAHQLLIPKLFGLVEIVEINEL